MSTQGTAYEKIKQNQFLSEEQLARFLGYSGLREEVFKKVDKLRQEEKLPFIKIDRSTRIYYIPEVIKWLFNRKTVLGAETENEQG
jgi:biotin operon repressor